MGCAKLFWKIPTSKCEFQSMKLTETREVENGWKIKCFQSLGAPNRSGNNRKACSKPDPVTQWATLPWFHCSYLQLFLLISILLFLEPLKSLSSEQRFHQYSFPYLSWYRNTCHSCHTPFSVAVTECHTLYNSQKMKVYSAHSSGDWKARVEEVKLADRNAL